MPITATCPHCSGSFTAPDSTAGKRFKCPSCKQPMTVPTVEEAAAAAAGGDDVIDIPSPEEAEAMVGGDADEDEDDADDAEEEAEDDADEDDGKKSKRDRKSKRDKDKKDKKKKEKKPKVKKERADIEMPEVDANAAIGNVIGSLTRALHPSRVLTAAIGMALVLFAAILVGGIGVLIGKPITIQLFGGLGGLIFSVGYVVVMVAIAKVDLADLRGEEVPGVVEALKNGVGGGVGAIIAAFLINLLVIAFVLVQVLIGLLLSIPYLGLVLGIAGVPIFFLMDLALLAGLPLIMWLLIPLAADSGANPIAPIKGAIGRVRREPARLAISFIMFVVFTSLILGVLWILGAAAAAGAFSLTTTMQNIFYMGHMGNTAGLVLYGVFTGGGAAIVLGLLLSPILSAYVCSGCQEIAENPWDGDDE
ncbi:MAG: zinc ribbon domain-containing protein [Planctomycetota bacterium]|jgi:hypothetical protein